MRFKPSRRSAWDLTRPGISVDRLGRATSEKSQLAERVRIVLTVNVRRPNDDGFVGETPASRR